MHLRIEPTQPRRVQHGLFTPAAPEPEKLELTLGKIRGLVGAEGVLYPKLQGHTVPEPGPSSRPSWPSAISALPTEARIENKETSEDQTVPGTNPKHGRTMAFQRKIGGNLEAYDPRRTNGDLYLSEGYNLSPGPHRAAMVRGGHI